MRSMGFAGNGNGIDHQLVQKHLDRALAEGRLDSAIRNAQKLSHVTLDRALRITVLMAREESSGYPRAAKKFFGRFMREYPQVSLDLLTSLLRLLASLEEEHFDEHWARKELLELADAIGRQEVEQWGRP